MRGCKTKEKRDHIFSLTSNVSTDPRTVRSILVYNSPCRTVCWTGRAVSGTCRAVCRTVQEINQICQAFVRKELKEVRRRFWTNLPSRAVCRTSWTVRGAGRAVCWTSRAVCWTGRAISRTAKRIENEQRIVRTSIDLPQVANNVCHWRQDAYVPLRTVMG